MRLNFIFLLILTAQLFPHNSNVLSNRTDSTYIAFLRIKGLLSNEYDSYLTDKKCGFGLVNSVKLNLSQYSQEQRDKIQSVLQRPIKQATLITPSGKFKIHYDTIGANSVKYTINELARALDSVYNFEVNIMGFPPAPDDFGIGGDNLYDVYIHNISPLYGYTEFENVIGPNRYTSFMVIDDSYHESEYYTKGIDGARVTVAHEYHHAIQIGNYRYADSDIWFYELTSTSMEEFVFDSINDYYSYMPNFFNKPGKIFTGFDGYSQAIWNIYLNKIFNNDFSIFVRQWELISNKPALEAIKKSIEERGKSFKSIFSQFYLYNYYTGYRSKPDAYYEEGINYPLISYNYSIQFTPPSRTINGSSQPCAANYYLVIDSLSRIPYPPDSVVIIIVNSNVDSALSWSNLSKLFNYSLKISNSQDDLSFIKISTNLYSKFIVSDPTNWTDFYIVNDTSSILRVSTTPNLAFPMPANLNKHNFIKIPVPINWKGEVDLFIYSSGMDLIYSSKKIPHMFDSKIVVEWDGKDLKNNKVPSGIYFYILFNDNEKSIGKIVIVNE